MVKKNIGTNFEISHYMGGKNLKKTWAKTQQITE